MRALVRRRQPCQTPFSLELVPTVCVYRCFALHRWLCVPDCCWRLCAGLADRPIVLLPFGVSRCMQAAVVAAAFMRYTVWQCSDVPHTRTNESHGMGLASCPGSTVCPVSLMSLRLSNAGCVRCDMMPQAICFPASPAEQQEVLGSQLHYLNVHVASADETLGLATSENYTLNVAFPNATLSADTVYGVRAHVRASRAAHHAFCHSVCAHIHTNGLNGRRTCALTQPAVLCSAVCCVRRCVGWKPSPS